MKTVASIADVHRLALATGATAEINGHVFNAAQLQRAPKIEPKPPAAPPVDVESAPPPVPASPSTITRAEVEQLVADRDAFWMGEMRRMTELISQAMIAARPQAASAVSWSFEPTYDRHNLLSKIVATPVAH